MAQPLVTADDVQGLWRSLTGDERVVAVNKIAVASALLRHHLPWLDDRLEAGTLDPDLVKGVVADAVIRSMQGGADGLRSRTDTRGPFSETRVYRDAADYGLAFTPAELALLSGGGAGTGRAVRVRSIRTASPFLGRAGAPSGWRSWTF